MVIKKSEVEQKAISVIEDIFNSWCSDNSFPYNADTSDLRSNDKGKYYDGQIVINHKLAGENKGLRFFIQSKGTTASSYSGMKNYKELLRDINDHKMPTFLFIVYLEKNTNNPKKFEFLFLNEQRMDVNFSIRNCTRIEDLKNENNLRNAVEEIIGKARRHYFYSLSNRLVNNIPTEIHHEVDKYNNLLDREFHSVKKYIYPDIWKFSIFYNLQRGSFGRAPIPYGCSSSLIQEIPADNHFWQEICDSLGYFNWNKDKLSIWLLQRDLEICIKNRLFDLSCLNNVPRFGRIHGMNIEVDDNYAEKIFMYLVENFEDSYNKFCKENFPLLKDVLKLNFCTILSPKVTKPNMGSSEKPRNSSPSN